MPTAFQFVPGDEISFYVNCDGASEADAQLVRLIHGDAHEAGPGHVEVELESPVNGRWAVKKQFTQLGSFLKVDDPENKLAVSGSFSLMAFIWPAMPQRGSRQTILGRWDTLRNTGYALGINPEGHLEFWVGNGSEVDYVTAELPLLAKVWYLVGVSYDRESGRAELYQEGVLNRYNSLVGKVVPYDFASHVVQQFRFRPENKPDIPFLIAGARDEHALRGPFVNDLYAGKIDRPAICNRALRRAEFDVCRQGGLLPEDAVLAFWDTSKGYSAQGVGHEVIDTGPHRLNAKGVNHPVRGMTGGTGTARTIAFELILRNLAALSSIPMP